MARAPEPRGERRGCKVPGGVGWGLVFRRRSGRWVPETEMAGRGSRSNGPEAQDVPRGEFADDSEREELDTDKTDESGDEMIPPTVQAEKKKKRGRRQRRGKSARGHPHREVARRLASEVALGLDLMQNRGGGGASEEDERLEQARVDWRTL